VAAGVRKYETPGDTKEKGCTRNKNRRRSELSIDSEIHHALICLGAPAPERANRLNLIKEKLGIPQISKGDMLPRRVKRCYERSASPPPPPPPPTPPPPPSPPPPPPLEAKRFMDAAKLCGTRSS